MTKIAIYGAGGCAREILMTIEKIVESTDNWFIEGFYDDGIEAGKQIAGHKVLGGINDLNAVEEQLSVVVGIADPVTKERVVRHINNPNIDFPVIIDPSVEVWSFQEISLGAGTVVLPGTVFTHNISLGAHTFVHMNSTIGHDTVIGDFCSLMPATNISGEVTMENNVYVGTGANILQQHTVGYGSFIGAGATVINDIPARCTAVGVPAQPVKYFKGYE